MAAIFIYNKPFVSYNITNNSLMEQKNLTWGGLNPDQLLRKPVLYHCATGLILES